MDTWMWIAIWALVVGVTAALWLRERRHGAASRGKAVADPRGASDVTMRMHMRDQGHDGGGGS